MSKPEIFVSVDVETNGPVPGLYSMLSFGSAAYNEEGKVLEIFSANLATLPDAKEDPKTMEFWDKHTEAYWTSRKDLEPPVIAITNYYAHLAAIQKEFPDSKLLFIGYPAVYDFMFMAYYFHFWCGQNPFNWNGLDIKTYAMTAMNSRYHDAALSAVLEKWNIKQNTHIAIDDACSQGLLFFKIRDYFDEEHRLLKHLQKSLSVIAYG